MAHQDRLGMGESWVKNWENVALAHKHFSTQFAHIAMFDCAYNMGRQLRTTPVAEQQWKYGMRALSWARFAGIGLRSSKTLIWNKKKNYNLQTTNQVHLWFKFQQEILRLRGVSGDEVITMVLTGEMRWMTNTSEWEILSFALAMSGNDYAQIQLCALMETFVVNSITLNICDYFP